MFMFIRILLIIIFLLFSNAYANNAEVLYKMFIASGLVPSILNAVPPALMNITINHEGKTVPINEVDERNAAEIDEEHIYNILEEAYNYTLISFFVIDLRRQLIDSVTINLKDVGGQEINGGADNETSSVENETNSAGNETNSGENDDTPATETLYSEESIKQLNCRFLIRNKLILQVWLLLKQSETISSEKTQKEIEEYDKGEQEFQAQNFIGERRLTVLNGAAIKINCDKKKLKLFYWLLLPVLVFLAICGICACFLLLYSDYAYKTA